ncbi:hypothetical protein MHL40_15450 [Pseudomonas luteola]|uniref:hypothetical protein n=1 Tax=Pseudomonas luteola TaxID=47886 RepID=UPI0015E35D60|nr:MULTISPECIES: hypothetical protein [Pseudomonas]MBA1250344.1 hypothetical protein [Pseudomonas zeshuii]MCG7374053.1 hypothetical protein [Pseudomonas luteola]
MSDQTELDMSFGSPDRETVWKARPLGFKARHRWNVLSAFISGRISVRSCLFGLRYPAAVVCLAMRRPEQGLIVVCPETNEEISQLFQD